MGKSKRLPEHYVNNREFTIAVTEYVRESRKPSEEDDVDDVDEVPQIPSYIADCFMRISEGLSTKPNFSGYTFREDMVMDGVENCVMKIRNFDADAVTRSGQPNAFAYFTQICYNAFIRRINSEQRQQKIRAGYIEEADYDVYVDIGNERSSLGSSIMENIRQKDISRESVVYDSDS